MPPSGPTGNGLDCWCRCDERPWRDRAWSEFRDDAAGLANWNNALLLGAALGGSLAVREEWDDDVRDYTAQHPRRWGTGSEVIGKLGEYPAVALVGMYAYSLHAKDEELRDVSGTLLSAYALTGLATLAVKAAADTDRPSEEWNDGRWGFPSMHASGCFSIAAVLDEYYGPRAGLPAYAVAGLISWSRIDERDHDLSDVVFGAALGWVIGKSVASNRLTGDGHVRVLPYCHPAQGGSGLMMEVAF